MVKEKKKFSSRKMALLWMLLFAVIVGVLIAYEQISILYVLVTLGLVILLSIVGFADLERVGRPDDQEAAAK